MKKIFNKLAALILLVMCSGNVLATDYYISDSGNDSNDGLSAANPFATLSKAIGAMANGDVLYVSGVIKMDAQCKIQNKQVTIIGDENKESGFDGENKSGILYLYQAVCKLENLCFLNGQLTYVNQTGSRNFKMGAAITSYSSIAEIDNCVFKNNQTVDETTNANQTGGALFFEGTRTSDLVTAVSLVIKNSQFINNKSAANGGAASVFQVPTTIENCIFDGNECYNNGGALNISNPKSYSIKQCCFVGNSSSTSSKGVINVYLRNSTDVGPYDIVSSTFYNNSAVSESSVMGVDVQDDKDKRTFNIVNCTFSGNMITRNVNGDGCIRFYGQGAKVNVVNSIIEGNTLNGAVYRDLAFNGGTGAEVAYTNSIVGSIYSNRENSTSTSSLLNKTVKLTDTKYAGLASFQGNCFPLLKASLATNMGTAENRPEKDQLGNAWTENYIGAVQKTVDPEDGSMYVASLNDDGSVKEYTICRTLVGGEWNTLCLPFPLNKDDKTEFQTYFGGGAKIACIDTKSTVEDGVITFTSRSYIEDMVAKRPYLVKPANDVTFTITKEKASDYDTRSFISNVGEYKFIGVLNSTDLKTTDVCLGKGGAFFHPDEGKTTINGLRGYFQFPDNVNPNSAKVFIGGVSDTTDIIDLKANGTAKNAKIYTLGGQYMGTDTQSLPKGIYVIGNKKVVIK